MGRVHRPLPAEPVRPVPTTDARPAPEATTAITADAPVVLSILLAAMATAPAVPAATVRDTLEETIARDGRATVTTRGGHIPARRTTRHVRSPLSAGHIVPGRVLRIWSRQGVRIVRWCVHGCAPCRLHHGAPIAVVLS